jgi:putative hydrolase of the HAD superfamily
MSEPWQIHTLVFDLDDTLYPESDYVRGGFEAAGRWLRATYGVQEFATVAHGLFGAGRRGRIFDEVLPRLGLEARPELIAGLIVAYREHEPQLSLFADAAEVLEWAGARFQLALVTDGYAEVQKRKIRALGLESRIGCRIITDELGREFWKPNIEPFRRVMEQFVGDSKGYLYVGDNAHKDFLGPRNLGWRTVRIQRPHGEHAGYGGLAAESADHEIQSLLDLRNLITSGFASL